MLQKQTFDFLKKLKNNNNRGWFNKNKPLYEAARENFQDFVGSLIISIVGFDHSIADLEPKGCIFRIYRDVRFSKDKSPYKANFGAAIVRGGRKSGRAGYYFHLAPGDSFLAGGLYMPPNKMLNDIRQEIDYNTAEFKKIVNDSHFINNFGKIQGDKLKSAPRGYPKDHPEIELLKYKSYLTLHKLTDKQVLDFNIVDYAAGIFKTMQPFNNFLNTAIE